MKYELHELLKTETPVCADCFIPCTVQYSVLEITSQWAWSWTSGLDLSLIDEWMDKMVGSDAGCDLLNSLMIKGLK